MNFAKFLRTPFLTEQPWWLLLLNRLIFFHVVKLTCGVGYIGNNKIDVLAKNIDTNGRILILDVKLMRPTLS